MKTTAQRLASSIGVTKETIRHYRQMGLLHPEMLENGYYTYTEHDALCLLLAKEMGMYNMHLESVRAFFGGYTIADYNARVSEREEELERQLERIQLELERMRETKVYASCGIRILNKVEEFDGPPTWAVGAITKADGFLTDRKLERWVEHSPFTYVSGTIPLKELQEKRGAEPYALELGCGALIHYVEKFNLPLHPAAHYQPGGHFIRTCIKTKDVLSVSPRDIGVLLKYAAAHNYVFASCTGGRLLFIEQEDGQPMYYFLVWVRVAPA